MHITSVMINIHDPKIKELVKHYAVSTTPTTIIIDTERKVMDKIEGQIKKRNF